MKKHEGHPKRIVLRPRKSAPTRGELWCGPCNEYIMDLPLCGVPVKRKSKRGSVLRTCRAVVRLDWGKTDTCGWHNPENIARRNRSVNPDSALPLTGGGVKE